MAQNTGDESVHKRRSIGNFLYWCAGADATVASGDPLRHSERVRYTCIGLSVLLTGMAAFLSMILVLGLVMDGFALWHLLVGFFWGLLIFNLDRWLVSMFDFGNLDSDTDGSLPNRRGRFVGIIARFMLALLIATAVSEPVILTIFKPEISRQVESNKTELNRQTAKQVRDSAKYTDRIGDKAHPEQSPPNTIEGRWYAAQKRAEDAQTAYNQAKQYLEDEVAGRHGTGVGCSLEVGSPCLEATNEATTKYDELTKAVQAMDKAKIAYDQENDAIEKEILAEIREKTAVDSQADGLLAQEHALDQLTSDNPGLLVRTWIVRAIFVLVDLLPMLFKIFSPVTLTDRWLRIQAAEMALRERRKRETGRLANEAREESRRITDRSEIDADQQVKMAGIDAQREIKLFEAAASRDYAIEEAKLALDYDLGRLRWRYQHRTAGGGMAHASTAVLNRPVDPQEHEVTDAGGGEGRSPDPDGYPQQTVLNGRWVVTGRFINSDYAGFGALLLAYDRTAPDKEVVIKRAHLAGGNPTIAAQAIEKDRYFQARVSSEFVAPVLDASEHPLFGTFIVTPRYPTTLLRQMPTPAAPRTLRWVLQVLDQILVGLIDSWHAGCVHLDIKPANVALDDNGDVRLIDFGLAKAVEDEKNLPTTPEAKFTRWYAPLEQILRHPENGWATSACDVRAVGAIGYEMLTGLRPLHCEALAQGWDPQRISHLQFIDLLRRETPVRLRDLDPRLPESLDQLINMWLSRDPHDRIGGELGSRGHVELAREALVLVRRDVARLGQLDLLIPADIDLPGGFGPQASQISTR